MYYDEASYCGMSETTEEFELRQKEAAAELKRLDKQYDKYTIPFKKRWTDGKYYKRITIENYGSNTLGSFIRNAVTGSRYDIRVGSAEEDLLFKVIDACGKNGRKDPLMLYYDSPEQYENHHFKIVSPEVKQRWYGKYMEARARY